jgi:two-component system NarL family sensor kinase
MDTKEAQVFLAVAIIVGLLIIFMIFFFITIIRHQKKNIKLHKEKIYAEISTLEKERKRVSADLHDGLGPLLSTVKFQIKSVELTEEDDKQMIISAGKHIDDMLIKIREIANDLRPTVLVRAGFVKAIEEFAETINLSGKILIACNMGNNISIADKEKEMHLYRIAQEIINNAIKHADSLRINVDFKPKENNLLLKISDFGKGFNTQEMLKKGSGLGLRNIMSRVEVLNGDVYIDSTPGNGTVYSIEIPNN